MNSAKIEKMPLAERLAAMENLWASLSAAGTEMSSPSWHCGALAARRKQLRSGQATFYTLAEVRKRLA